MATLLASQDSVGKRTTFASTASSFKIRMANAWRPLTHCSILDLPEVLRPICGGRIVESAGLARSLLCLCRSSPAAALLPKHASKMGWPDIHWLARDLWGGWWQPLKRLGQELEYAVGAKVGSLWVGLPPPAPRFDGAL